MFFFWAQCGGGVLPWVCPRASIPHASVPPERRQAIGLSDSLIRISAGIEDIEDLREDLEQALGLCFRSTQNSGTQNSKPARNRGRSEFEVLSSELIYDSAFGPTLLSTQRR